MNEKIRYGNAYNYILRETDELKIKDLLLWHKIVKVDIQNDLLVLDNGVTLMFFGNEGCGGCESGWYSVTELNGCDNVITDVQFECEYLDDYDGLSYKIFVFAEDKKIKLVEVDGTDGNGYYGTGYSIRVIIPRKE